MSKLISELIPQNSLGNVMLFTYFMTLNQENTFKILPCGHGSYYPLKFNTENKDIIGGELNFFNEVFYSNHSKSNNIENSKFKLEINKKNDKCIIINILDNCFGHSLQKLLNIHIIYEKYNSDYDIIVLSNKALEYLIPKKINTCIIKYSFKELEECYNLQPILDSIKNQYDLFDFAPTSTYIKHNKIKKLKNFYFNEIKQKLPNKITFYYRKDSSRKWNGNYQRKNILKLYKLIKPFFQDEIKFYILGDLDNTKFPNWVIDKRINKFSKENDNYYNQIFSESIVTFGVMGSSMIIPSILSKMTIHLVPTHKKHNICEDMINFENSRFENYYKNINVNGNQLLSDVSPKKLANETILMFMCQLEKSYKEQFSLFENQKYNLGQTKYITNSNKYFNYFKAKKLKLKLEKTAYRKIKINKLIRLGF